MTSVSLHPFSVSRRIPPPPVKHPARTTEDDKKKRVFTSPYAPQDDRTKTGWRSMLRCGRGNSLKCSREVIEGGSWENWKTGVVPMRCQRVKERIGKVPVCVWDVRGGRGGGLGGGPSEVALKKRKEKVKQKQSRKNVNARPEEKPQSSTITSRSSCPASHPRSCG